MNTLHTVKTIKALLCGALIFGAQVGNAAGKQPSCQFMQTCDKVVTLVRTQRPELVQPIYDSLLKIKSIWIEVARIGDPSIESGPVQVPDYTELEVMKFKGIIEIISDEADALNDHALELDGKASKELMKVADDVRAMCAIVTKYVDTYKTPFAARLPLNLKKLKNDLKSYDYLMPAELERSDAEALPFWRAIIEVLHPAS